MKKSPVLSMLLFAFLTLAGSAVYAKSITFSAAIKGEMVEVNFTSDGQYGDCKATANYSGKVNGKDLTATLECTGAVSKGSGKLCDAMHKMANPKVTSVSGSCK
jgi:hypothetical protein